MRPSRLAAAVLVAVAVLAPPAAARDDTPSSWIGIMMINDGSAAGGGDARGGVGVRYILEDSPAAAAGLRARDRILAIDGNAVSSSADLLERLRSIDPGAWIEFNVERGGEEMSLDVRLGERPESTRGIRVRRGWAGLYAIDLPDSLREHFGAEAGAGVMVSDVKVAGPAEAAGMRVGDLLVALDGEPVTDTRSLRGVLAGGGVGNTLEATVVRYGAEMVLEVTLVAAAEDAEGW